MSIYESLRNWNFPKDLIYGFCQKSKSLLKLFLFLQNKFLFVDILGSEKAIFVREKGRFLNSRKDLYFPKRLTHCFQLV